MIEAGNELPPGWAVTTLGEIVQPTRPRRDPRLQPDLPFIGMEHVQAQSMRLLGTVPAGTMNSSAVHFQPDDVLYGRLRPYLNKVCRPDFEGLCSAEFIVLPFGKNHSSRFLAFLLNSSAFVDFASHLDEGDRPRVDFQQIAAYPVNVPPLPEQRRIVAEIERQFSLLDAGVAGLRRVQANLRRYRASVLQDACAGRLVPTEAELARTDGREYEPADALLARVLADRRARWEADQLAKMEARGALPLNGAWKAKYQEPAGPDTAGLPELPKGWIWASVEQLGSHGDAVLTGPFGTSMGTEDFTDAGVPVLTIGCLKAGGVELDKARFVSEAKAAALGRYRLRANDFLFSRMASVGRAGVVGADLAGALFNYHIMRLRLNPDALLPTFYLAFVRGAKSVTEYVVSVNHGATRDGINTEQLLQMPVAVPPTAEQHRIVAEVERRLSVVDQLEDAVAANLKRAGRLRQAILRDAFAGRLVPQDPDDEPADALLERIRAERATAQDSQKSSRRTPAARQARSRKSAPSGNGRSASGDEAAPAAATAPDPPVQPRLPF